MRRLRDFCWLLLAGFAAPLAAQVQISAEQSSPATPVLRAQSLQFSAQASATAGGPLEYRWDFGDGTPRTPWLPEPTADHTYSVAGAYTVLVQVRHPTQGLASATLPMVVRLPPAAAARASSSIVLHAARREVWVVNPDHGTVGVLDADALTLLDEVLVQEEPSALAIDASGRVWVALAGADALLRMDPATRAVDAQIDLGYGARPVALLFDASGWGYVAEAGHGRVRRFSGGSGQVDGEVAIAPGIEAMALSADGSALFVSQLVSQGEGGAVWRLQLPLATATPERIALPLDTSSPDSGTAARGLPNYVAALALSEDGSALWYGGKKDNVLRGLFREGQPLTFESSLRSLLGRIDVAAGEELLAQRLDLDDAGRVSGLLLAPGSSHLFATQETNNRVLVIDPWNRRVLARMDTGRAPRGMAFDPLNRRLFVQAFLSRGVDAYAVGEQLDSGVGQPEHLASVPSAFDEPLAPQVLAGKRVFYNAVDTRMGQDGYFSCAACHLDGRGDGRVWDFTQLGEGLRNTTSLLGSAGMGRGRVHWTGNFDEIQDFEVPIRDLFGGLGFMDDIDYFADGRAHPLGPPKAGFSADLDALAAYVASLDRDDRSPHRAPDGSLTATGAAGRQLFEQLSCHRCHSGEAFTNSAAGYRHDVGTLGPGSGQRLGEELLALDTPSLRGLFNSAPYLHDGSAATLSDVIGAGNDAQSHAETAALSAQQREQLVAFLLQIDGSEPGFGPPPALAISAPAAGAAVDAGSSLPLAISTDLPEVVRVDYRVDGVIVASASAAPWTASWLAAGNGPARLHADVLHDGGRLQTLSPALRFSLRGAGPLFTDGFETPPR
ncbi:MAG: PKD domain-containing protein [Aquimonas sp.]|nr:PKD domain-containing protein [Aquimonas sp.]